MDIAMDTN